MGTRITREGAEKVYEAASIWVERALRTDDSLFTPGQPIWSSRWLGELRQRFLDNPDEPGANFLDKLQGQLEGSPPEVYQLMGEALYFYFLIVIAKNSAGRERIINSVLNWSPTPVAIPTDVAAGLTPGIANPGQAFHRFRPYQLGFLIEFVEQWKEREPGERRLLLDDPWAFKDFVMGTRLDSPLFINRQNTPRIQRQALLHLVFPDTFEAIVSVDDKEKIAKAFANYITQPTDDVDRQLAQIRPVLEAKYGSRDHFYYWGGIRVRWDDDYKPDLWGEFVRRAREYVDTGRLEGEEIEYKIEIGRKLAEAREAALAVADGWDSLLKRGISGNLINRIEQARFRDWIDGSRDDALIALQALWTRDASSVTERVRDFCDLLPRSASSGPGVRTTVASVLLMGLNSQEYPPFRVTAFNKAYQRTGYEQPEQDADESALYEHALGFLDRFIGEAEGRGLTLRHRLDAQSVVWAVQYADWEPDEEVAEPGDPPSVTNPWSPESIEALAGELLWEAGQLQKIVDGLKDKRQVIFQGPPGTGKTYVAKRIAKWCQDHGGDFQIVQFHPSYSYEDFVEGFRPTLDGGQAGFKLTDGPLRRIAKKAQDHPEATFILVIDEINRGNVAKVLGELYFLLEYREDEVALQYSNEPFSLPKNLWFIGTMNTTDRSIALVDAALRRRFYFFGFYPDEPPVQGLLERWLEENSPGAKWVAGLVDSANGKLGDRHLGIGPSHFMKNVPPLDENRVRFIWEQAVIPYIEEQCFGDEAKLERVRLRPV